jgi:hypothetical protein
MPDVKIGIPAMLVCLEMAFFSILHIWAYPWKPYSINRSPIIASESGASFYPSKDEYKGGFLGIRAYLDAFNPWDFVKAIGRGFRWIAVGRKTREQDSSYKHHLQGTVLEQPLSTKPGRYQRLDDEGSPTRASEYVSVQHRASDSLSHPAGDIGVAQTYASPYAHMDERTVMPGRLHEDGGFEHAPSAAHAKTGRMVPQQEDTSYHGAAYPRQAQWPQQPRRPPQPAQPYDASGTGYGIAYGGESQVDMPDPNQWHAR